MFVPCNRREVDVLKDCSEDIPICRIEIGSCGIFVTSDHTHHLSDFKLIAHFYVPLVQSVKMRFFDELCPPAFLYAIFLAVHIGLDVADMALITAAGKVLFGGITVYILDILCRLDLGVVSWFIVALPFIITSLATAVAMGIDLDRQVFQRLTH